ncbi:Rha family transcriptional regulator [Methylobacterium sp. ID0610]|uniref:Rha family transcriptional regulator n=1 Tax=Methylobacterium carpenticola TaxID=3344827 RepID=UPI0036CCC75A
MTDTKTFKFAGLDLRCEMRGDRLWFVAADVCAFTEHGNVTMALRSLPAEEKAQFNLGHRLTNLITEAGLYRLVMRARKRKPAVAEFQDWVTKTVLPAIRKDGMYVQGEEKVVTGEMSEDELILKAVTLLQAKVERLSAENAVMKSSSRSRDVQEPASRLVKETHPMNMLTTLTNHGATEPTMSSLEIADLTGKEHRNVMRDIRVMLEELHGEGGVLSFEQTHRNPQNGQSYPIFRLPKRECLILVSGYSVALRARIVDHWQELESKQASSLPDFSNPAAAARAWAEEYEARQVAYERLKATLRMG